MPSVRPAAVAGMFYPGAPAVLGAAVRAYLAEAQPAEPPAGLPKALLVFIVDDAKADGAVAAIVDAARSGNESGDGLVWTTPVSNVTHNRTGLALAAVES